MRLMLDIETFSRRADAAVFEVAIVPFHEDGKIDPPGGAHPFGHWLWTPETGHFEGQTVVWWMARGGRADLNPESMLGEAEVTAQIHGYLSQFPEDTELWAQHTSFDCVILQGLLERCGWRLPQGFRQWRDLPTLRAAAGGPRVPRTRTRHAAVNDCMNQIELWVECRRLLGLDGADATPTLPPTLDKQCDDVIRGVRRRLASSSAFEAAVGHGEPGPQICGALSDAQVAYLENKRAGAVWSAQDFNQHLRSMLD